MTLIISSSRFSEACPEPGVGRTATCTALRIIPTASQGGIVLISVRMDRDNDGPAAGFALQILAQWPALLHGLI